MARRLEESARSIPWAKFRDCDDRERRFGVAESVALNDDFPAELDAVQHAVDVARQICFADV
jgi:hypothetical protein